MCWFVGDEVSHWRCGGSLEMCWLTGDMLAWRCGGSMEMCWLTGDVWLIGDEAALGDVVANWRCGGSLEMWWLMGDVVAHWRCAGSLAVHRLLRLQSRSKFKILTALGVLCVILYNSPR